MSACRRSPAARRRACPTAVSVVRSPPTLTVITALFPVAGGTTRGTTVDLPVGVGAAVADGFAGTVVASGRRGRRFGRWGRAGLGVLRRRRRGGGRAGRAGMRGGRLRRRGCDGSALADAAADDGSLPAAGPRRRAPKARRAVGKKDTHESPGALGARVPGCCTTSSVPRNEDFAAAHDRPPTGDSLAPISR